MRILQADNRALWLQFKWLGNPNAPWWFEATGRAWMTAGVLIPLIITILWNITPHPLVALLIPGFFGYFVTGVACTLLGFILGILATRWVGKWVTPAEPLTHHVAVFLDEVTAPRDTGRVTTKLEVPPDLFLEHKHRRTIKLAVPPTFKAPTP